MRIIQGSLSECQQYLLRIAKIDGHAHTSIFVPHVEGASRPLEPYSAAILNSDSFLLAHE